MFVLSYCDIPEEITDDTYLQELPCDVYTTHHIPSNLMEYDELDTWIIENYPQLIDQMFLIEMDY